MGSVVVSCLCKYINFSFTNKYFCFCSFLSLPFLYPFITHLDLFPVFSSLFQLPSFLSLFYICIHINSDILSFPASLCPFVSHYGTWLWFLQNVVGAADVEGTGGAGSVAPAFPQE